MIRVSVLYPNSPGSTFDMDYYLTKHMPMVRQRLGAALKGMMVDQGISGGQPGTEALYRTIAYLMMESVEVFEATFSPHAPEIMGDIPRFTNISPTVQISEVKM